jgi:farnesyl diphosphate synthase
MRYAAIGGGKRVRPLLLTATARCTASIRSAAVQAGCAIEAIHVYSLIHDDLPCMDDDAMRHGKPTVHKAFDEATAVLAGDSLHAWPSTCWPSPRQQRSVRPHRAVQALARASGPTAWPADR